MGTTGISRDSALGASIVISVVSLRSIAAWSNLAFPVIIKSTTTTSRL